MLSVERVIVRILAIFCLVVMTGCASLMNPSPDGKHVVLGSTIALASTSVVKDVRVGDLHIRQIRKKVNYCQGGTQDAIELSGPINSDAFAAVENLISNIPNCATDSGGIASPIVILNSPGGYLIDGYKLGELFRSKRASTLIAHGQICASSCAVAFIGGHHRGVIGDGKLLFHSPYRDSGMGIECASKDASSDLKRYLTSMLGQKKGEYLFERTMSYCSSAKGWEINSDAANIFGISTRKYD